MCISLSRYTSEGTQQYACKTGAWGEYETGGRPLPESDLDILEDVRRLYTKGEYADAYLRATGIKSEYLQEEAMKIMEWYGGY